MYRFSDFGSGITKKFVAFGRNASVGTTLEELSAYDAALDWNSIFSSAAAVDVSSSSANDTGAGTGARKILIFGVDANFVFTTEEIVMNGQTKVAGVKNFLRIFGAEVVESGSGRVNAGDIHIVKKGSGGSYTGGVPGTLTSAVVKIMAGWGASGNGHFTTPADEIWILEKLIVSSRAATSTVVVQVQDMDGDNTLKTVLSVELAAGGSVEIQPDLPDFGPKIDIRIRALSSGGSIVSAVGVFKRKYAS